MKKFMYNEIHDKWKEQEIKTLIDNAHFNCDEEKLKRKRTIEGLMSKHVNIKQMYFGYREKAKSDTILVAILSKDDETIPNSYNDFNIYQRKESDISKEAENVMLTVASNKSYNIPKSIKNALKDTIAQNLETLLKDHSNITIVSFCPIKSSRMGKHWKHQQKICIVIYCRVKGIIPAGEHPFPKEINGFPVDVREGYAFFTSIHNDNLPRSSDVQTPLRLGAEISTVDQSGTLGMFVDLDNNDKGFITCAHFAYEKEELRPNLSINNENIPVFQPKCDRPENRIGYLEKAIFHCNNRFETSVDAALVRITIANKKPVDGYMMKCEKEILRFIGFPKSFYTNIFTVAGADTLGM
ncbi:hypothetical protein KUTeg_018348 [Tegillarca granosa]|uniref:Uncharacterized protein n=1 Tax=Tegillarca granosa TaxID=220873 RepID=A0ABQ9EMJ9_TEGGR|nr:hypothetical protein KUTeg_018348 [Tegillarca granosa]